MPMSPQAPIKTTGETVTVGCKIPSGIVANIQEMRDVTERRIDGTTYTVPKSFVKEGTQVTFNGSAKYRGGGREKPYEIYQGAGLTFGVDADFFEEWSKSPQGIDLVKNGYVFAHRRDTHGKAVEHKAVVTGLEPLNPKNLPPEFRNKIEAA